MKLLLGFILLAMAIPHMSNLGLFGYFPVIAGILAIFVATRRVYLPESAWYVLGGATCLLGMFIGSVANGTIVSKSYVAFGTMLFFFYPIFRLRGMERYVLKVVFYVLLFTLIPIGFSGSQLMSIYDNPNNYSGIALCTLYFGLVLFYRSPVRQLLLYTLITGLIFLGASRSIFGAVLIFGLLYFIQRYLIQRRLRWVLVGGFAVMCFAYYSLVTDDRFRLLATIQENTVGDKQEKGLSHRDKLFVVSLGIARDFPEGVGMGRSNVVIGERYEYAYTPHNTFLKALVEGGSIMLVGFLIVIVGFLLASESYLATAFVFALLVRGLFESSTPFSISLISSMWVIPMFLDEQSVRWSSDLRLRLGLLKDK